MPEPEVNPNPRGTLAWAEWEMAHQTAPPSAQNQGPPAGTKVTDSRYIEYGGGPNGTNAVHERRADGSWSTSYTSVGTPSTSGSGPKSGGAPSVNYAEKNASEKAAVQQQGGAMAALPPRAFEYAPGRAYWQPAGALTGSVLQYDSTTHQWVNNGYSVSAADRPAVIAGIRNEVAAGRWNAAPGASSTQLPTGQAVSPENPGARMSVPGANPSSNSPFSGLAGAPGTLDARSGPVLPGFDAFRQPGIGIPSEGRQTINGISTGLNTLVGGRQGSAVQIPVTPGFRGPDQTGNSIQFAGGGLQGGAGGATGGGRVEPQMVFAPTSISVPGTYVYGQGNTGAANAAYQVPFNIGPGGASLANIAGNNVQIQSADKGTGYGYAINAMPASSVFAATGRDPSNDPASQAAQALMLNTALNQFGGGAGALQVLTAANANQFGGYHAGTGNDPFSGNGGSGQGTYFAGYDPFAGYGDSWGGGGGYDAGMRAATGGTFIVDPFHPMMRMAGGGGVAVHPLPGMSGGPHQLVTNEPMVLVGTQSHMVRGLVGEDNADPGTAPNRELLNFRGNSMHVTPLEPPKRFDVGGDVNYEPPPYAVIGNPNTGDIPYAAWQTVAPFAQYQPDPVAFLQAGLATHPDEADAQREYGIMLAALASGANVQEARDIAQSHLNAHANAMIGGPDPYQGFSPAINNNVVNGFANVITTLDQFPQETQFTPLRTTSQIADAERRYNEMIAARDGGPLGPMYNERGIPRFATGGTITNLAPGETGRPSSNQYQVSYGTPTIPNQPGVTSAASGATDPTQGGFTGGGYVPGGQGGNGNFGNTPPTTPDPTDPNLPPETLPPAVVPPAPPVPGSSPLPTVVPSLNPLDPTIIQPFQSALNTLDQQQALRNLYQYRRQAGGLGRELGRTVLSGDMPAGDAGPGAYWDMRPQVETAVNNILGAQNAFRQLGPIEDITPVQARASYLGNALDDMQKIRDLEIAKAAADSGVSLTQQGNNDLHVALETAQAALQSLMASGATPAQIAAQQAIINDLTQQVNAIGGGYQITSPNTSAGQAAKIQAQIDALKARLPANANESDLRTELALLNDRIGKNQKRIDLTQQVANLQKAGVPSLSAPIVPVDPFRSQAA